MVHCDCFFKLRLFKFSYLHTYLLKWEKSGKWDKKVRRDNLRWQRKMDGGEQQWRAMDHERLFHRRAAAGGNALSPTVDSRVHWTSWDNDEMNVVIWLQYTWSVHSSNIGKRQLLLMALALLQSSRFVELQRRKHDIQSRFLSWNTQRKTMNAKVLVDKKSDNYTACWVHLWATLDIWCARHRSSLLSLSW